MSHISGQAARLRTIAADTRLAAEAAGVADRVALLRSARSFEWVADVMEDVATENTSPVLNGFRSTDISCR
jgi:uncharacterized ferredoxin-like protein